MDLESLRYAESHEWAKLDGDIVTVGITRYAAEQLGDLVYVEVPKIGRKVKSKEEVATVEAVKTTSPIYSPVDGEVVENNASAVENADVVHNDPLGEGWLFKVKLATGATLDHLKTKAQYDAQLAEEAH